MSRTVVAVDVGGTFTDCVAWTGSEVKVAKVSTTEDQSDGVMDGAGRIVGERPATASLHGSTVVTNALLEQAGADTVLITDAGFEDVIEIGRQDRPSLYNSFADRATPLVERGDRWGWDPDAPGELAARLASGSAESVAVSLAYSFADPSEELAVAEALSGLGIPLSLSNRVVGELREFERTSTTVLNAYLGPSPRQLRSGCRRRHRER